MAVIIKDQKLVIKTEQNTINFDLHENDLSVKQNQFLTENTMETVIMNI